MEMGNGREGRVNGPRCLGRAIAMILRTKELKRETKRSRNHS
jgi:hypothetical protein